jgi:large subunit ribosomal protein L7/L12
LHIRQRPAAAYWTRCLSAPSSSPSPTTHRLSKDQIAKVDAIFHKLLWLDMFEISILNDIINEKLGIVLTPKQRSALAKQIEALDGNVTTTMAVQAEAEPEAPKTVDVKLTGYDEKSKIKVIKEVRAIAGLGLKEAKELVESLPKVVMKGVKPEDAAAMNKKLVEAGAKVELV